MMKTKSKSILVFIMMFLGALCMKAQDITVTVTPVQQVLPPQALLYISDPGKYFTIQLTNTSATPQQVYLNMAIRQVNPESGMFVTTPANRQPTKPFVVPSNGVYQLTNVDMKNLFNHVPSNEISCTPGLFESYNNGSFGLLPEGLYQARITAYKWSNPQTASPVVASTPLSGTCNFTICYKAKAPEFLTPMLTGVNTSEVVTIDPLAAQFTWTQPVITCAPSFASYEYDFRVVELLPGQKADDAMDHNPIVYQTKGLVAPLCVIPTSIISTKFKADKTYIAQVVATARTSSGTMDYVQIANEGKSVYRLFKLPSSSGNAGKNDGGNGSGDGVKPGSNENPENGGGNPEKGGDDDDDDDDPNTGGKKPENGGEDDNTDKDKDIFIKFGNTEIDDSLFYNSDYNFRNPSLISPKFEEDSARKFYLGNDIPVEWHNVMYLGGEGENPEELKFEYDVLLFKGDESADKEATLQGEPIYKYHTDDTEHTIEWESLKDKISANDYFVLKVQPTCTNTPEGKKIGYHSDSNICDFAYCEHVEYKFFECSSQVVLDNFESTDKTLDQLKGSVVAMGEYQLTIDEIQNDKEPNTYKGKGRIEWNPMGAKIMICVQFDTLKINTDNIAIGGLCKSVPDPAAGNNGAIVDKLFCDYGLDNLLSDHNLPYANQITSEAKNLAKKLDLAKYYEYYKVGKGAVDLLTSGNIDELYLPIRVPEGINSSPVDLQIGSMQFAPTWATMDLIGEFVLPDSKYTENDILVFGAPRLCISPDTFFPESGTVALLKDINVVDPNSSFKINFKAPKDLISPKDGCYVAWHDYKFEIMGIDVDMTIPKLKKDVNGQASKDNAVLTLTASISDWDNWMVNNVNIDPFQVEDLPGWTFNANNIVYDHSFKQNSQSMGSFPTDYVKSKNPDLLKGDTGWQGLYIKDIGIKFPKSFEFGSKGDKRLEIHATDMFFDASGATLSVGADDVFSAETGKLGGWKFTLDKAHVQFVQSDFNNCSLAGKLGVPLLTTKDGKKADLAYNCEIRKQLKNGKKTNGTAYLFTIQQIDNEMNLDMFVASAEFQKNLTYVAVEAESPEEGATTTRVECLMGGNIRIGGVDKLEKYASSKIGIDIDIPDVHFVGLRIANCDVWTSQYTSIKNLQSNSKKDDTKILLNLYKGNQINNSNKTFFFNPGAWSLASLEKKVGPFEFKLTKYDIGMGDTSGSNTTVNLTLAGSVGLVKGIDISAGADITLSTTVKNISDISNISVEFKEIKLNKCEVHTSFSGVTIDGSLTKSDDKENGKGFDASLDVKLPGDIFDLSMAGAYYKYKASTEEDSYTWGYLYVSMKGKTGIPIPPVQLNGIKGGFYFNCQSSLNDPKKVTKKYGAIGVLLGMSISTVGASDVISGDMSATIAYDKNRDGKGKGGLTQFLFTGNVKAVSGLIDSKVTLLYEHTAMDEYFQLNITADISADNMALCKELNSAYQSINDFCESTGNLTNLEKGEEDTNKKNKNTGSNKKAKTTEDSKETASLGKASVELEIKITKKENGKKLDKVKWHVYLGEPDEKKRCKLVLIDFKSKIVTLTIGANAYVCVGNELPGDGQLPPIPSKISKFLNGSSEGNFQGDDISKANSARARAVSNFGGSVSGGVMFGAQVYGNLDVNLGIIYGSMDALAGFDVSLRKLSGASCMNIDRSPGWHEWYGQGQLYAYFAAALGIRVNLGFFKKDIPVIDAALGGVLEMGGPNPTYFMGAVRAKINLLGGLVNINKKFEFECGNVCQVFAGNPLDNFILFDYCSLGDSIKGRGWNKDNRINPVLREVPYINTNAGLDEHFRVLDENEFQRIIKNYNGDVEKLKMDAERTFVFRASDDIVIYEYSDSTKFDKKRWDVYKHFDSSFWHSVYGVKNSKEFAAKFGNNYDYCKTIKIKGGSSTHHLLDMAGLKTWIEPNKYYRIEVKGRAFEIEAGQEVDPITYNTEKKKYEHQPWSQCKEFFFATGKDESFADTCNLEDYIAIAYPSHYNKLRDGVKDADESSYHNVYLSDAKSPTIALTKDISTVAYKKGKLYWRILNTKGRELYRSENAWVKGTNTLNMEPQNSFTNITADKNYILSLDYVTYGYNSDARAYSTADTLNIGRLHMHVLPSNYSWRNGSDKSVDGGTSSYRHALAYEKPFLGVRMSDYNITYVNWSYTPTDVVYSGFTNCDGINVRYFDPFNFVGYWSNYAFIGGWRIKNGTLDIDVTTSQSAILNIPHVGLYEGKLGGNSATNIYNDYKKIRSMFLYDYAQYGDAFGSWPVPASDAPEYDYLLLTDERTLNMRSSNSDLYRLDPLYYQVRDYYQKVANFESQVDSHMSKLDNEVYQGKSEIKESKMKQYIKTYSQTNRGTYITENGRVSSDKRNEAFLSVPYYQIPIEYASSYELVPVSYVFDDLQKKKDYRAYGDVQSYIAHNLWHKNLKKGIKCKSGWDGTGKYYNGDVIAEDPSTKSYNSEDALKLITSASIVAYRVNGYNYSNGQYTVITNLKNGSAADWFDVSYPFSTDRKITKTTAYGYNSSNTTKGTVNSVNNAYSGAGSSSNNTSSYDSYAQNVANARANIASYEEKVLANYANVKKYHDNVVSYSKSCISNAKEAFETNRTTTANSKASTAKSKYNDAVSSYSSLVAEKNKAGGSKTNAASQLSVALSNLNTIKNGTSSYAVVRVNAQGDYDVASDMVDNIQYHIDEMERLRAEAQAQRDRAKASYDKLSLAQNPTAKAKAELYAKEAEAKLSEMNASLPYMRGNCNDAEKNYKSAVSDYASMEKAYNNYCKGIYTASYNSCMEKFENLTSYNNTGKSRTNYNNTRYQGLLTAQKAIQTSYNNGMSYTVEGTSIYNRLKNCVDKAAANVNTGRERFDDTKYYADGIAEYYEKGQDLKKACEKLHSNYSTVMSKANSMSSKKTAIVNLVKQMQTSKTTVQSALSTAKTNYLVAHYAIIAAVDNANSNSQNITSINNSVSKIEASATTAADNSKSASTTKYKVDSIYQVMSADLAYIKQNVASTSSFYSSSDTYCSDALKEKDKAKTLLTEIQSIASEVKPYVDKIYEEKSKIEIYTDAGNLSYVSDNIQQIRDSITSVSNDRTYISSQYTSINEGLTSVKSLVYTNDKILTKINNKKATASELATFDSNNKKIEQYVNKIGDITASIAKFGKSCQKHRSYVLKLADETKARTLEGSALYNEVTSVYNTYNSRYNDIVDYMAKFSSRMTELEYYKTRLTVYKNPSKSSSTKTATIGTFKTGVTRGVR